MLKQLVPAFLIICIIACNNNNNNNVKKEAYKWPAAQPPVASEKEHLRIIHNDTVNDPYYWMYDYFGKGPDSTKVVDYLTAENTYLDTMMSGTKKLQADLFTEMKSRIKEKDESVPVFKNGYFYYTRTDDGKQYYKYCRKKESLEAKEEVLLDVDELAKGHAYYSATGYDVSPDNKLLTFGVDTVSRREYIIHVKNLETGEVYKDAIYGTEGSGVWAADNKTFFYTSKNPVTLLSEKIKRHVLGTDAATDATVYVENDKSNYIGVGRSKNGKQLFIYSQATLSSEIRSIDAATPLAAFTVFQPRIKEVLYEPIPLDDKFLILTNWNAKNFRLMECPKDKTDTSNWKEVIAHRTDVLLQGVEEFKDFIVINERKDGLVKMRIRSTKDNHPAE